MKYGTGVALVLMAGVLWSVQGLLIRQIHDAGTWTVLFWRSLGMIPVLLAFIAARSGGRVIGPIRSVGMVGVLGGLGLVLAFSGAIYALQATTVAMAVFLFSASPFFSAVLGRVFLGESVRSTTWGAIALAVVGIGLMVREGFALGAMAGNIAALISALGFSLFTLALRWGKLADMIPAVALGGMFSMVAGAAIALATGQMLVPPVSDILYAVGMGAISLVGGMVLYTLGSRVIPAAELTLFSLIEVMLAPIWVWLLMGETTGAGTLWGGAVLMVAVMINALSGLRLRRMMPAQV